MKIANHKHVYKESWKPTEEGVTLTRRCTVEGCMHSTTDVIKTEGGSEVDSKGRIIKSESFTITKNQIRTIWAIKSKSDIDDLMLYDIVEIISGGRSISILSKSQGSKVIKSLKMILIIESDQCTKAQRSKIYAIGYDLKWNTYQIRGYMKREVGKNEIHDLNGIEAHKVIVGMTKTLTFNKSKNENE